MRIKSILKTLPIAGCFAIIFAAFAPAAFANGDWGGCSTSTFKGSYGFTIDGTVYLPSAFGGLMSGDPSPIQGVQMIYSDGKGNLTDKESIILAGNPLGDSMGHALGTPPGYFSQHHGTYTLDSDCTGVAFLTNEVGNTGLSPDGASPAFVWLAFVVDEQGSQVRMVVVPPFDSGGITRTVYSIGQRFATGTPSRF